MKNYNILHDQFGDEKDMLEIGVAFVEPPFS